MAPVQNVPNPHSTPSMRIVHIVPSLKMGGLETLLQRLVTLQATRWNVHVVCLDELGELAERVRMNGAEVHYLDGLRAGPVKKIVRLSTLLRRLRPDVVHTHNQSPHVAALMVRPILGATALVHTRHGQHVWSARGSRLVHWLSARWTDRLIAVSGDAARLAAGVDQFPESKIRVVHNAVDVDGYRPAQGPLQHAIAVGRVEVLKDHAMLLRATEIVRHRFPHFRLTIVGDGSQLSALQELTRQLGIDPNVTFLGAREDVHEQLFKSGLFVLSSRSEGVPLTLLEAMASRLPIVSTGVGGVPEIIEHEHSGLLVPPADPAAFAAAICRLLEDPLLAARLAAAAHAKVRSSYSLAHLDAIYEGIYHDALCSSRTAAGTQN